MATYFVLVREVHISTRQIEAKDPQEAMGLVMGGDGIEVDCEWSHALPADTWEVDDSQGNTMIGQYTQVTDISS